MMMMITMRRNNTFFAATNLAIVAIFCVVMANADNNNDDKQPIKSVIHFHNRSRRSGHQYFRSCRPCIAPIVPGQLCTRVHSCNPQPNHCHLYCGFPIPGSWQCDYTYKCNGNSSANAIRFSSISILIPLLFNFNNIINNIGRHLTTN